MTSWAFPTQKAETLMHRTIQNPFLTDPNVLAYTISVLEGFILFQIFLRSRKEQSNIQRNLIETSYI